MLEELLEESEVTQEFRKRGLEQGRAEGLAIGKAEGKAEGERLAIATVLEARFGSVSEDVRAALAGVRAEDLPALVAAAATEPVERVRARLGLS